MSNNVIEGFPISPRQEELWHEHATGEAGPMRVCAVLEVEGFDEDAVRAAFEATVARHEVLRTTFASVAGMKVPLQSPVTMPPVWERVEDGLDAAQLLERLEVAPLALGDGSRGRWCITRDRIVRVGVALPAALADARTLVLLAREAFGRLARQPIGGDDEVAQYADVAAWLGSLSEAAGAEDARRYWTSIPPLPRSSVLLASDPRGEGFFERVTLDLDPVLSARILAMGPELREALHLTAWASFVSRFVEVASTGWIVDGRSVVELAGALGPLATFVPVPTAGLTLEDGFELATERIEAARSFADFLPAREPESLRGALGASVIERPRWGVPGAELVVRELSALTSRVGLEVIVDVGDAGARVCARFERGTHRRGEVSELVGAYAAVLGAALGRDGAARLPPVARSLLDQGRGARAEIEPLVHERFFAAARRWPERTALRTADATVSFAELEGIARRIAATLASTGRPGDRIAIHMGRSVEAVAAMLGALAAGRAYVPIDPDHPVERRRAIAASAKVALVLIKGDDPARTSAELGVDAMDVATATSASPIDLPPVATASTAYVLFTSGSTGRPKGVVVPHGALANQIAWFTREFPFDAGDRVLHRTAVTFDASVWEIFAPLVSGAELFVPTDAEVRDMATLRRVIEQESITVLQLVPTLLRELLATAPAKTARVLRRLFVGGEALDVGLAHAAREAFGAEVVNLYGPTECTVQVLSQRVEPGAQRVPLGRPVAGARVYVTDAALSLVPRGVPGEIAIGGVPVADGYDGDPRATARRFVPDPFSDEPGARMYRTGDVGVARDTGVFEFLGRDDDQVKVRGIRVELGDIEAHVQAVPDVSAGAVAVVDGQLVAYVVPRLGAALDARSIRERLASRLPSALVPTVYVVLDELPRATNGKLDRRALPRPDAARRLEEEFVAPRSDTERQVAAIWCEVLGLDAVGCRANFFTIGGHSLRATQIVARVRDRLGVDVGLERFLADPTVAALADAVEHAPGSTLAPITRSDHPSGRASLLQERLYVHHQLADDRCALNATSAFTLRGSLDVEAFARAVDALVARHRMLRTRFEERDGRVVCAPIATPTGVLTVLDLRGDDEAERSLARHTHAQARTAFVLDAPPLIRFSLIRMPDRSVAVVTVHQLVCDEWSMRNIVYDLAALYRAESAGAAAELPVLAYEYTDWAASQRSRTDDDRHRRRTESAAGWFGSLVDRRPPSPSLPRAGAGASAQTMHSFAIDRGTRTEVQRRAREDGTTEFAVLLSAYGLVVHALSGVTDLLVGGPIASRSRATDELLVGPMFNTALYRMRFSHSDRGADLLRRAHEGVGDALTYQDIPFEHLMRQAGISAGTRLFDVWIAFQNVPARAIDLPLAVTIEPVDGGAPKFPLGLLVEESEDGYRVLLEHHARLLGADGAERFERAFVAVLEQLATDPSAPVVTLARAVSPARPRGRRMSQTAAPE